MNVTVGRILHYIPSETDPLYADGAPLAAIVAFVGGGDGKSLNLTVSRHDGYPVAVELVPFVVEGDPVPTQSYATWPARAEAKAADPASPETTGGDGKSAAGLAAESEAAG